MNVLLSLLCGFVVGLLVVRALLPALRRAPFLVHNFRDEQIPTAAGLAIVVTVILVEGVRNALGSVFDSTWTIVPATATLTIVGAFTTFGLLDDLAALPGDRGFKGHLRALAKGRLTTGSLKLFGGGLVALAVSPGETFGWLLLDAAVIALSANLVNLFDLRPGRALKVVGFWAVLLFAFAGLDERLAPIAAVVGAGMALFVPDLRARLMMGDTGSNPLGAALGLGIVMVGSDLVLISALIVLVVLTLVGDLVGFTKLIGSVRPLRLLDEFGRPKSAR